MANLGRQLDWFELAHLWVCLWGVPRDDWHIGLLTEWGRPW
jgi:hypothetical protein